MRTISGKVVSAEAISLTRAASILSDFVSNDHGSSQAVRSYLRRTSASFDDLLNLHQELYQSANSLNPQVKHNKTKRDRADHDHDFTNESNKVLVGEIDDGGNVEANKKSKKKKKKKRKGSEL